jgi:hypothetical protein
MALGASFAAQAGKVGEVVIISAVMTTFLNMMASPFGRSADCKTS